jgi:hypothetical protein
MRCAASFDRPADRRGFAELLLDAIACTVLSDRLVNAVLESSKAVTTPSNVVMP